MGFSPENKDNDVFTNSPKITNPEIVKENCQLKISNYFNVIMCDPRPGSAPDYFKLTRFLVKLFFDSFDYVIGMTRNKITLLVPLILAISVQFNDILRDINYRMW